MEREGDKSGKYGLVFVKLRAGKGRKTPLLVTMTASEFAWLRRDQATMERYTKLKEDEVKALQQRVKELEEKLVAAGNAIPATFERGVEQGIRDTIAAVNP